MVYNGFWEEVVLVAIRRNNKKKKMRNSSFHFYLHKRVIVKLMLKIELPTRMVKSGDNFFISRFSFPAVCFAKNMIAHFYNFK